MATGSSDRASEAPTSSHAAMAKEIADTRAKLWSLISAVKMAAPFMHGVPRAALLEVAQNAEEFLSGPPVQSIPGEGLLR